MLFRLLLFRFLPLIFLAFMKDRRLIQKIMIAILGIYMIGFIAAVWDVIARFQWVGVLSIPLLMLPHYLCYGFAGWIMARCLWFSWSNRVWKRISLVSMISILVGVYLEAYWNPKILQIFFKIFK